jgi:hypothetical protein
MTIGKRVTSNTGAHIYVIEFTSLYLSRVILCETMMAASSDTTKYHRSKTMYTCRKISPSFVDHHKYTRWWPASRGKGTEGIAHEASCSPPLALSIFPSPWTMTQLRLADILRPENLQIRLHLTQDRVQLRNLVNTVTKFRVPQEEGNLLTSWAYC